MSRLQHSLHALPFGSVVSKDMAASNAEMNRLLDEQRRDEVVAAKQIQHGTGMSWAEAVRKVAIEESMVRPTSKPRRP